MLDPMFEKPQKAQVVRIKIEALSLDSTSMAPSLDRPLLAPKQPYVLLESGRSKSLRTKLPLVAPPASGSVEGLNNAHER